jgi:hypothetical protein
VSPGGWRRRAQAVLIFERLWPVLWPPAGILGLYLLAALLDLPQRLGPSLNTLLLLVCAIAALGVLGWGLRRFRWPGRAQAEARLQRDSGLRHSPMAALRDRPAQQDRVAEALWLAHQARSRRELRRLRLGLPRPGLAARDHMALRGALVVALVAAVVIAGPQITGRLGRAFTLDFAFAHFGGPPPTVTAWVTPPAYTGRAPFLVSPQILAFAAPAGSRLTVTVAGTRKPPVLRRDGSPVAGFRALDTGAYQAETMLAASGPLLLRGNGDRLARWQLEVIPDRPPNVAFVAPPVADTDNPTALRLAWRGGDDYGVTSLQFEARLATRPQAPPLVVPIALPDGSATAPKGVQSIDFSTNSWAGLPVSLRLVAKDALGQAGSTGNVMLILPERRFSDPFARQAAALRRLLVAAPEHASTVGEAALKVGAAAAVAGRPAAGSLALADVGWALRFDTSTSQINRVTDELWQVALHFEQGPAAETAQSLRAAEDALRKALQAKNAPNAAELSKLMQAVRAALLQHLSALMQMAQRQGGEITTPPDSPRLDMGALAQTLRQMEAAARAGDAQAMRQSLASLERSLRSLEQARVQPPDPAREAARRRAEHDLAALQAMLHRQAGLMDRANRRAESESNDTHGQHQDATAQDALHHALQSLLAGRRDPSLGAAGHAMGDATHALQGGADGIAANDQGQAMRGLQSAIGRLGRQLAAQSGGTVISGAGQGAMGSQPGDLPEEGFGGASGPTDPFGRPLQTGAGVSLGADLNLPQGSPEAQLRAILQDLRRRAGEHDRPQPELDYIDRLLQPF